MLEAQAGSFLSSGGMLREGLLQMAEEIAPLPGMVLLGSENKLSILTQTYFSSEFQISQQNSRIGVRHRSFHWYYARQ